MPKKWEEISDDEILNYEADNTGRLHRYERIIQKKTINALDNVRDKLTGLMETVYRANQNFDDKTDELIQLWGKYSKSQARQQIILIILSIIIASSTIAYTIITWQSVKTMREANSIQKSIYFLESKKFQQTQKPETSKQHKRSIGGGRN